MNHFQMIQSLTMHILFIACTMRFPAAAMENPREVYHLPNCAIAFHGLLEHQTGVQLDFVYKTCQCQT
jgi:hypothetical protein